jgi:hypothetical protein
MCRITVLRCNTYIQQLHYAAIVVFSRTALARQRIAATRLHAATGSAAVDEAEKHPDPGLQELVTAESFTDAHRPSSRRLGPESPSIQRVRGRPQSESTASSSI